MLSDLRAVMRICNIKLVCDEVLFIYPNFKLGRSMRLCHTGLTWKTVSDREDLKRRLGLYDK
jgi:hypothetical protein